MAAGWRQIRRGPALRALDPVCTIGAQIAGPIIRHEACPAGPRGRAHSTLLDVARSVAGPALGGLPA